MSNAGNEICDMDGGRSEREIDRSRARLRITVTQCAGGQKFLQIPIICTASDQSINGWLAVLLLLLLLRPLLLLRSESCVSSEMRYIQMESNGFGSTYSLCAPTEMRWQVKSPVTIHPPSASTFVHRQLWFHLHLLRTTQKKNSISQRARAVVALSY